MFSVPALGPSWRRRLNEVSMGLLYGIQTDHPDQGTRVTRGEARPLSIWRSGCSAWEVMCARR